MSIPIADVQTLKTIGIAGLSFFVIRELIKIVWYLIRQRKSNEELVLKNTSREKINTTNNNVAELRETARNIKPEFFNVKEKVDDIHDVITEKEKGVPLVYNKGLELAVDKLNTNVLTQANAIKDLTGAIKDMKKSS